MRNPNVGYDNNQNIREIFVHSALKKITDEKTTKHRSSR